MKSLFLRRFMRLSGSARPVTVTAVLSGALLTTVLFASVVNAQGFKQRKLHPIFDDPAEYKRMVSAAKRFAYTEDVSKFADINYARAYYRTYLPAKITQLDSLSEVSALTKDVRKRLHRATQRKAVSQPSIRTWLFDGMKPIAEGKYLPAARINAILLIAAMETSPATVGAKRPPSPLKSIPDVLVPIYTDIRNPDGVRAAALKGIRRYVRYAGGTLSSEHRTALIASMNDLLSQETPVYRNSLAHAYLQRFAVDILVGLQPIKDAGLAKTLVSVSTENKNDDLIAIFAASRLANLDQRSLAGVGEVDAILGNWTRRAARALDAEGARLARLERPKKASQQPINPDKLFHVNKTPESQKPMPSMGQVPNDFDMDESGMENEMPEDVTTGRFRVATPKQSSQMIASRRKLNQLIEQLHLGATGSREIGKSVSTPAGLLASGQGGKNRPIEQWTVVITQLLQAINDPQLGDQKTYREVLSVRSKWLLEMAEKLSPKPAPARAPRPESGDPFVAQSRSLSGAS